MHNFFRSGLIPPLVNFLIISLIPKNETPTYFLKFRPISLCNLLKSFTKTLAKQICHILPKIRFAQQGAFIKGKEINEKH